MAELLATSLAALFLVSGLGKAVHSGPFLEHLRDLRLFPEALGAALGVCWVGLELALAAWLWRGVMQGPTLIFCGLLLALLTSLGVWAARARGLEQCGCYGSLWTPSPALAWTLHGSLGICALVFGLGSLPWEGLVGPSRADLIWILQPLALGVFLAGRSARRPLLDLSVTRVGRRWEAAWLPRPDLPFGAFLVAFVRPGCPRCELWTRELGSLAVEFGMPLVLVSTGPRGRLQELGLADDGDAGLEQHTLEASQFRRLAVAVPSALLVADGRIRDRWIRTIPPGARCVFRRWQSVAGSAAEPS